MSAVKQEVKTINSTQSLALVRNMLRLSISTICYTRNLFPMDCFSSRPYGDKDGLPVVYQLEVSFYELLASSNNVFIK